MSWGAVDSGDDAGRFVVGLDRVNADPFFRALKARIAELAVGERAMDVGCGTGAHAAMRGAVGMDASSAMVAAGRSRDRSAALVQADAYALPVRDDGLDVLTADRVLQHLDDVGVALAEWRRALGPGGRIVTCDPDLTTAAIEGVDPGDAAAVLEWRMRTRPGASAVADMAGTLTEAGFSDVVVEPKVLELMDLDRADGAMGLAEWGGLALDEPGGRAWRTAVERAAAGGTLRYTCTYVVATAMMRA